MLFVGSPACPACVVLRGVSKTPAQSPTVRSKSGRFDSWLRWVILLNYHHLIVCCLLQLGKWPQTFKMTHSISNLCIKMSAFGVPKRLHLVYQNVCIWSIKMSAFCVSKCLHFVYQNVCILCIMFVWFLTQMLFSQFLWETCLKFLKC